LSCTGATASRNYFPGLTEAYYRKLPILAITSTREECKIGHLIDQQIDRTCQPKDTVLCSEHLQVIKDEEDLWDCTIKVNRAILALKTKGGGPAHINLPTLYSPRFTVETLPPVRKIDRLFYCDKFPDIGERDVSIFIGTHKLMTIEEQNTIDRFCEVYNAVVYCDICCGYHGKYGILMFGASNNVQTDLLIHIGEVSCSAYGCKPKEVWRVSEDGEIRDTFRKLSIVFSVSESYFFSQYVKDKNTISTTKFKQCKEKEETIYNNLQEVPFSNGWIASYLCDKLPHNTEVHLGIVSSYFAWNRFKLHPSITIHCNQGGFGIDGNLSTLLGASLINPQKLFFCFIGDLAFFYDMNALGNRHLGKNIRILLVNNGKGVIFRKPGNMGSIFKDEADDYMAAAGHFGNQSPNLVKNYSENLGFKYLSATTKEEFINNTETFTNPEITEEPILFEVFVTTENEILGDNIKKSKHKGLKNAVKDVIGDEIYASIRDFITGNSKGAMPVDVGHNK